MKVAQWYVQHAAMLLLVFAIMDLYNLFHFSLFLSIPFSYFFFQSGIVNSDGSQYYQHVLVLCAFLTGVMIPDQLFL